MLSYRVILDVPLPLAAFVSRLLAAHRHEIGTRSGTRALTCWKQALFTLAWFRDRPDIRRLGQGAGISQATAYRYKDEAVEVLAAKAPTLRETLDKAIDQGLPYLEIAERVHTSTATVTRVAQWLRHGAGGYTLALERTS